MMIDKNRTYKTRDGREVRIYATDGIERPVHGAVKYEKGWFSKSWHEDGRFYEYEAESILDLIEVRPRIKRTVWLAVMEDGCRCYDTELDAQANHLMRKSAIVKVEIDCEEGHGL